MTKWARYEPLRCQDLVEQVSDYLGHGLPEDELEAFEEHLVRCRSCAGFLGQQRDTLLWTATLKDAVTANRGGSFEPIVGGFRDFQKRPGHRTDTALGGGMPHAGL